MSKELSIDELRKISGGFVKPDGNVGEENVLMYGVKPMYGLEPIVEPINPPEVKPLYGITDYSTK